MIVDVDRYGGFMLDPGFLRGYRDRPVRWGYGALSWMTFKRSYSRNGESWWQTCRRVIEGTFTVQRVHCLSQRLPWDEGGEGPSDGPRRLRAAVAVPVNAPGPRAVDHGHAVRV